MNYEEIPIKLIMKEETLIVGKLKIYEESPESTELVLLELILSDRIIKNSDIDFFSSLQKLREELEKESIQIMCNGAALNVYPSPIQLSMGSGRTAHLLTLGQQTRREDIIDIFDCDENLTFVSVAEQSKFNFEWINSIIKKNFV